MNDPMSVKDIAETAYYTTISLAALVGGAWAVYRYWFHRVYETVLRIGVSVSQRPLGEKNLVFVQVTLANKGKRRIAAKRVKAGQSAYADKVEQLQYCCSLQVKRVSDTVVAQDTYLDWFRSDKLQPIAGLPSEINLLDLYVEPKSGEVSEWLEPGEREFLGTALVLSPGDYVMKVTFIGDRRDTDFWSRIVYVHVAAADGSAAKRRGTGALINQSARGGRTHP